MLSQDVVKMFRRWKWEHRVRGGPGRRPRVLTVSTSNGKLSFSNMDAVIGRALYCDRAWECDLIESTMTSLRRHGYVAH